MRSTAGGERERISDAAVFAKTGKTWNEWFEILDAAGAEALDHKGIVAILSRDHSVDGWWAQSVTVAYEQERGKRLKHETPGGFQVSASKTVAASPELLYAAWTDETVRERWLPAVALSVRKATPNKSLRVTWDEDGTSLDIALYVKGPDRTQVTVQHSRLPDAATAEQMKSFWKEHLEKLTAVLEA